MGPHRFYDRGGSDPSECLCPTCQARQQRLEEKMRAAEQRRIERAEKKANEGALKERELLEKQLEDSNPLQSAAWRNGGIERVSCCW